jgi:uncharacterized protein (DUF58 family)
VFRSIRNQFYQRYLGWVNRRIPPAKAITLNQRRIFIFPSRQGFVFLLFLLVMLLAAINYENNMAFALVFLLLSMFVVSVLHTYANLSGLTIKAVRATPGFAGDNVEFEILLSRPDSRRYFDILASWPETDAYILSLDESPQETLKIHLKSKKRGLLRPERLLVETYYPVGLLRAWTLIALDIDALVYPRPVKSILTNANTSNDNEEGETIAAVGSDDFYGFREYHSGDSIKHIFWKNYAKGQGLHTKQFSAYSDRRVWLEWESVSGNVEQKLSQLCYWVLQLEKNNEEYGLRIPGIEIPPAKGESHQQGILRTLALYQWESGQ